MFKKLKKEFHETKQVNEDLLQWMLIRKLSTKGKIILALVLWILWMRYAFNIVFMFNFFKFIFIISIVYGVIRLGYKLFTLLHKSTKNKF